MTWWAWLIAALGGLGIAATAGAFLGAVGGIKAAAEAAMRDVDEASELRRLIDELRAERHEHHGPYRVDRGTTCAVIGCEEEATHWRPTWTNSSNILPACDKHALPTWTPS